jgi:hypothetical protein
MIDTTAEALGAMTGSFTIHTRVESWLGGELLDDDIPAVSLEETVDRTLAVPERVSLKVPLRDRGVSYDPTLDPAHPLAPYGQQLRLLVGVQLAHGAIEWIPRGWFLIDEASVEGDSVTVTAVGLLTLIDEARFVSPFQPTGTFASTLRKLVEPALTVTIDSTLTDRSVPTSMVWDEDRLGALNELLDAWPADAYVTNEGYLAVVPAVDPTVSVLTLTDGTGGTLVDRSASVSRDGAATVVVARGESTAGAVVQGTAYDQSGGPLAYDGNFNPLPVPFFYASPLLTTNAQANAAALTVLRRRQRASRQDLEIEAVPNFALTAGDLITVESERLGIAEQNAVIETLTMPLSAGGGSMKAGVRPV